MWYEETIWPTLVGLATVAVLAGLRWWETRKPAALVVALLCIPAAIGAVIYERQHVTPREEVTARLTRLVHDFEHQDSEAVLDAVSSRAPEIQRLAASAVAKVLIQNVRLTDINVEMSGEDVLRARTHFRVSADVVISGVTRLPRQPTRWNVTWEEEQDGWRILEVEQLDPITGEQVHQVRHFIR